MAGDRVKISGMGIHSGAPSAVVIRPLESGGIVFIRNEKKIPARWDEVSETKFRNTTVGRAPNQVKTIEHLMAALYVSEISGAEIEINNAETPILDGSAMEFINKLKGVKSSVGAPYIRIKKEIVAKQDELAGFFGRLFGRKRDGFVKLSPVSGKKLEITAAIIYKEPAIGTEKYRFVFDYDNFQKSVATFVKDIARSRTFGKIGEWEWLKKRGMALGANERNVIAADEAENGTLNKLYYPDEFVRHKIIDAVGDLYTSGGRIIGKMESIKGSHALNNLALKKLFADTSNYDIIGT